MEDLHGLFSHDSINTSGDVCGKRQSKSNFKGSTYDSIYEIPIPTVYIPISYLNTIFSLYYYSSIAITI